MKKMNKIFILISIMFYLVVTTILILLKFEWYYFLIGLAISIITHFIMIIQNKMVYDVARNEYGKLAYHPRISALLWYFLKAFIVIGFTILLIFVSDIFNNPNAIRIIFIYIFGYLSLKIIFIISILITKEGR